MTGQVTIDLSKIAIAPNMTVDQISHICGALSTDKVEVSARIEWRNGKPIGYLHATPRDELPPDFLRRE